MTAQLRPPDMVMRLDRMGASFPTRLSFMRVLMRRLAADGAVVKRSLWEMDAQGFGRAVYTVSLGGHDYSLVAFTRDLKPEERTDRVIAEKWDAAFALHDGVPDAAALDRLAREVPLQEAGRNTETELVLSRANKSVRLFSHVIEALSAGRQPDEAELARVGYLMRTTAVYGNGKFGIADRERIAARPGLDGPFMAEMLAVWLIRGFTFDLVNHIAAARGGAGAVRLDARLARGLGIGNATGLGMAPFLVSHPVLLNNWFTVRETALARVRGAGAWSAARLARMRVLAERAAVHMSRWQVEEDRQAARIDRLRDEWPVIVDRLAALAPDDPAPAEALIAAAGPMSHECQELTVALLIEGFGDRVDDLAPVLSDNADTRIDYAQDCAALAADISRDWGWATALDYDDPQNCHQFWYVSEEKAEPRLGLRFEEPGAERESPLDVARRVKALAAALDGAAGPVARLLADHPEHTDAVRRVQILRRHPYAEIRDNLIGKGALPIDMLRAKLACFGASRFDPKSDRWTRVTLFAGAPLFDELADGADDWWMPEGLAP